MCPPPQFEDASFEDLQGADARKAMLIIAVMAAHAFGEGSGVGVSFSGQRGWAQVGGGGAGGRGLLQWAEGKGAGGRRGWCFPGVWVS